MDNWELSVESEKLVSLRARLLRSLPSFGLLSLPSTGLGRSKPNCWKDLLKDVVLGWIVSWSCGGQLEDMLAGAKGRLAQFYMYLRRQCTENGLGLYSGWLYRSKTVVVAREKDANTPDLLPRPHLSKCRNKARYLIPTATHDGCTPNYIMYILHFVTIRSLHVPIIPPPPCLYQPASLISRWRLNGSRNQSKSI